MARLRPSFRRAARSRFAARAAKAAASGFGAGSVTRPRTTFLMAWRRIQPFQHVRWSIARKASGGPHLRSNLLWSLLARSKNDVMEVALAKSRFQAWLGGARRTPCRLQPKWARDWRRGPMADVKS